jgi:hypothetical protein
VNFVERALMFECGGETLVGVLAEPASPAMVGVLIIVGGPQYRAGSHRQFVLLSRQLAATGVAAMRFDYRGMGDSTGSPSSFDDVSEDIAAAIDAGLGERYPKIVGATMPEFRRYLFALKERKYDTEQSKSGRPAGPARSVGWAARPVRRTEQPSGVSAPAAEVRPGQQDGR